MPGQLEESVSPRGRDTAEVQVDLVLGRAKLGEEAGSSTWPVFPLGRSVRGSSCSYTIAANDLCRSTQQPHARLYIHTTTLRPATHATWLTPMASALGHSCWRRSTNDVDQASALMSSPPTCTAAGHWRHVVAGVALLLLVSTPAAVGSGRGPFLELRCQPRGRCRHESTAPGTWTPNPGRVDLLRGAPGGGLRATDCCFLSPAIVPAATAAGEGCGPCEEHEASGSHCRATGYREVLDCVYPHTPVSDPGAYTVGARGQHGLTEQRSLVTCVCVCVRSCVRVYARVCACGRGGRAGGRAGACVGVCLGVCLCACACAAHSSTPPTCRGRCTIMSV